MQRLQKTGRGGPSARRRSDRSNGVPEGLPATRRNYRNLYVVNRHFITSGYAGVGLPKKAEQGPVPGERSGERSPILSELSCQRGSTASWSLTRRAPSIPRRSSECLA